jgi:phage-related protein
VRTDAQVYEYMYNGIVERNEPKPLRWIGTSRDDLKSFPPEVRRDIGRALYAAQMGDTDPAAKPMKGFGGASVMEIIARFFGNTWRTVYTVRFRDVIYVLHAFQKKSKSGIATPNSEIRLVQRRLADASRDYKERQGQNEA